MSRVEMKEVLILEGDKQVLFVDTLYLVVKKPLNRNLFRYKLYFQIGNKKVKVLSKLARNMTETERQQFKCLIDEKEDKVIINIVRAKCYVYTLFSDGYRSFYYCRLDYMNRCSIGDENTFTNILNANVDLYNKIENKKF